MRLLFASVHSYLDPSRGAALGTRELLELLAARGMDCRVLCAGVLDHEQETSLDQVLTGLGLPANRLQAELAGGGSAEVLDLTVNGVRVTMVPTASSRAERSPDKFGIVDFSSLTTDHFPLRPHIPLLVVEGRGTAEALARLQVDLSGLTSLHRMANSPGPRHFYRVSRAVLVPSLWRESLGRVPMEAMANGIPVLASDRGALPETLGSAGFVFTIPERYTPQSLEIPTAREVAPWVAVLEKFWDDREFEDRHRELARAEARRWDTAAIAGQYERLFRSLGETRVRANGPSQV